jgi:hypothetical protein
MSEIEKTENLEIVPPSALEALQRAEVDMAITTAKRYPRDIAQSIKTCRELALRNSAVAATCNYAVPRAGKKLIGPSVHFARIVAYAWGNGTALSRVIGADRANVHLQGVFHDLQTNLRVGIEMDWPVQAPKTDTPERWADQINLAKRAGAAVALRTAIFNVIPQVLFADIAEEAKKVAVGEGKTFIESRNNAITALKAMGISQEMIYHALGIGGLESISTDDLIWLHAIMTSIKEGAMTVSEVFGNSMEPVKAQVPARGRGRPPKEVLVDIGTEKGPEPEAHFVEQAPLVEEPPAPPVRPPPVTPAKLVGIVTEGLTPGGRVGPETRTTVMQSAEPFPEPKPVKKKEAPLPPAPASDKVPMSAADQIRAKLTEAGLTEENLIQWLGDLGTVKDGTVSLETVNAKWLRMVLDDWAGILARVKEFLGRQKQ